MNLELTDEQLALRDTTRRFLAEKAPISGHVRALLDDPTGVDEAVWRGLADLGVGSEVTVELNGGGRGFRTLARLDADADVTVYRDGGLLQMMMQRLAG